MSRGFAQETIDEYAEAGHWDARTVASLVSGHARVKPDAPALIAMDSHLTWSEYDDLSSRLAAAYVRAGVAPGTVVAVLMTGGAAVHVAYLAAQKAGLVTLGIGPRAGVAEIRHLLTIAGARWLVTRPEHRGVAAGELVRDLDVDVHLELHLSDARLVVTGLPDAEGLPETEPARYLLVDQGVGADDIFFINSTSGTTGLPKCVQQTLNTRKFFGALAHRAGQLGAEEVFCSVVPAPYGFGQWSAHVVPAMYGYPTVLPDEFTPSSTLRLVQEHGVTVLAAVTSQFVMMLDAPEFPHSDLSTLRVLFTGGEPVPYARAAEFEDGCDAFVLQFYGSNEAGPISVTSVEDSRALRLATAGRVIPEMQVRLFAEDGAETTATGGPGRCAVRGPGITPGYHRDDAANAELVRSDGWMLTGDIVRVDARGYLTVTGRATDFIIRGGQNISTSAVQLAVESCPRVRQAAVVSRPDDVLGERVCAYVVTDDRTDLTQSELHAHLVSTTLSKQAWPEWLATLASLPLSIGGKVDRAVLRADALERFASFR